MPIIFAVGDHRRAGDPRCGGTSRSTSTICMSGVTVCTLRVITSADLQFVRQFLDAADAARIGIGNDASRFLPVPIIVLFTPRSGTAAHARLALAALTSSSCS